MPLPEARFTVSIGILGVQESIVLHRRQSIYVDTHAACQQRERIQWRIFLSLAAIHEANAVNRRSLGDGNFWAGLHMRF